MRLLLLSALLLTGCTQATAPARPEFALAGGAAGGILRWSGHTVVFDFDAPVPPDDHIVDDIRAGVYDIGLSWSTEPEAITGAILCATYYWRIPKGTLIGSRFTISAERPTPDGVVFILKSAEAEAPLLRSPVCPLEKGFIGTIEDIGKHATPIRREDIFPEGKLSSP